MTAGGGAANASMNPHVDSPKIFHASPAVTVDTSRYANVITIASANIPVASPSSMPVGNQVAGDGGGVGTPSPTANQPTGSPSLAMSGTAPTNPVVVGSGGAGSQRGAIRALSAAPTNSGGGGGMAAPLDTSGGSGGSGPTMAQIYGPSMSIYPSGDAVIGGAGQGILLASGSVISQVTWTASGTELNQNYSVPSGSTTDWTGVTNFYPGGTSQSFTSFYYNYQAGAHTISADVTFTDGSTDNFSTTVSIAKPTVGITSRNWDASSLVAQGGVAGGQFQGHFTLSAVVTDPGTIDGGSVGFLQLITGTLTHTQTNPTGGLTTYTRDSNGSVLDDAPGQQGAAALFLSPYVQNVQSGQTITATGVDFPFATYLSTKAEGADTSYSANYQFNTYLLYKPAGGIWVKLLSTRSPLQVSGSMSYSGPPVDSYVSPGGLLPSNAGGDGLQNDLGFVSWTGNWTTTPWNPPLPS